MIVESYVSELEAEALVRAIRQDFPGSQVHTSHDRAADRHNVHAFNLTLFQAGRIQTYAAGWLAGFRTRAGMASEELIRSR